MHLKDYIKDLIRKVHLSEWVAQDAKKYKDEKANKRNDQVNQERAVRA